MGPKPYELDYLSATAGNPYQSASTVATIAAKSAQQFMVQVAAGGLFSIFMFFWSVGYVVRAISFLPGKNEE